MRGRKPKLSAHDIIEVQTLKAGGKTIRELMEIYKCSYPVIAKALKVVQETKVA